MLDWSYLLSHFTLDTPGRESLLINIAFVELEDKITFVNEF